MKNICELYSVLRTRDFSQNGYTPVVKLDLSEKFLLGISEQHTPMFLIDCKFENVIADLELECISVLFNKTCKIIDDNSTEMEKICSVIILNSENFEFQSYFLEVIYLMAQNISKEPSPEQIRKEIDKIITLFSYASKPAVKTVQGLWAELLIIAQSQDPDYLIKSWHSSPKSKFDFNDGKDKIEVKSSSRTERIHTFALEQLNPNMNSSLIVASVFVVETGIGKNIDDLRNIILSRISDIQVQSILDTIIFQTLGEDLQTSLECCYDYQLALDEIRYYRSEYIPKISEDSVPPEVSMVKFSCDMTNVPNVSRKELNSTQSMLFRSL